MLRNAPEHSRSRKSRARPSYVADFETTTDADDCRVWAWGLADISTPETVEMGTELEAFLDRLIDEESTVYFHNLKFDGHFIIYWLLMNDYEHVTTDERPSPGSFKTLISDMGMFYSITVRWENGRTTEFRDSYKKIPLRLKNVAKAFKFEEGKGEIDYKKKRPVGHKLTAEEVDYLRRDVSIIAKAMNEVLASGMTKLTVASDSLAEYKRLTGSKTFMRLFPVMSETMDAEIRRAYRGGFTYADKRHSGRVTGSGLVLDVNSLYPSVMYAQPLPYGLPEYVDGIVKPTADRPLTVFSITFTAKLKRDHVPCIQIKGSSIFAATAYLTEIKEPTTLMMTNVDFALYNDHYDMQILSYGGGWRFQATTGMFDDYIDKWSKIKETETGGKREIAKLHLNSLYGKFASNPNVTSKVPVLQDGAVKLVRGADDKRPPVYTAVGVFITSYARDLTIRAAQQNFPSFAYADTDSLHLLTDEVPTTIDVHPTRMGAWKLEYRFDSAYYIRPKAYLERKIDGTYENHIAGVPEDVVSPLTFSDLIDGRILHGKLHPKSVPGGIVLKDVPFELKL